MDKFNELFQHIETQFGVELSDKQKRAIQAIIENPKFGKITGAQQQALLSALPQNQPFTADDALKIAEAQGVSRASTFRLLSELERVGHGKYRIVT